MNIDYDYLNSKNSEQYAILYKKVRKDLANNIVISSSESISHRLFVSGTTLLGIFIFLIGSFLYITSTILLYQMLVYIGLYLIIILGGVIWISWNHGYIPNMRIDKLDSLYRRTKNNLYTIEDLDEILTITEDLSALMINKFSLRKEFISFVLFILSDLRSDLQIRLTEQQKTLEQAKSKVEQTIKGTIELEQVSELQKARLDRQIEQFEELQRVLVKA